jgi:hypothetical protein
MSGKTKTGKPRKHPGVRGKRPDLKATRQAEAEERRLKHEAEGSPRAKKKRLAEKRRAA